MLKELPYKAWLDGLPEERMKIKLKIYEYNHLKPPEGAERLHFLYNYAIL